MKTPIAYYGGKQTMLGQILPLIPQHNVYVEPFFGGGAVFWSKPATAIRGYKEVLNDKNCMVVNFMKVLRDRFDELKNYIDCTVHSRMLYAESKTLLHSENPIEAAWAFWYQTNGSFAGKIGGGWAYNRQGTNNDLSIHNKKKEITEVYSKKLSNAFIECQDALKIIEVWDSPDTFFYLDPPYVGSNQGHYSGYAEADMDNLVNAIAQIQGKFLLSSYPYEALQERVQNGEWSQKTINKLVSVNNLDKSAQKRGKTEVLTSNYNILPQFTLFE